MYRSEVTSVLGDRVDDRLPDLETEVLELFGGAAAQISWAGYRFELHRDSWSWAGSRTPSDSPSGRLAGIPGSNRSTWTPTR